MCSPDTVRLCQRLLALGLLCACIAVFDSPVITGTTYAAGCIEECMDTEAQCNDNCAVECSTSETECGSCIETCASQFNSCTRGKVICAGSGGGTTYTPTCQVDYTAHCPVFNGVADCNHETAHYGYTLTCNTLGGGHCMACPDHNWSCSGSDGSPSCF